MYHQTFKNVVLEEKRWFDCNTHLFLLYIYIYTCIYNSCLHVWWTHRFDFMHFLSFSTLQIWIFGCGCLSAKDQRCYLLKTGMASCTFREGTKRNFLIGTERMYNVIKDRPVTISYCQEMGFAFPHPMLFPDDLFLQLMQEADTRAKPRGMRLQGKRCSFILLFL